MNCIITGCSLVLGNHSVSGDLFEIEGGGYVFNGNWSEEGICWYKGKSFYSKQITPTTENYFERRGVFVFLRSGLDFNKEAREYVAKKELSP